MPWTRDDLMRLVELEAHQQGVDPRLALALAEQENPRFDPAARSSKGAIGIMQLMPKTARGLKVDPTDVADNIRGGVTYLKQQLDAFGGDTKMALAAYNAGPGVVKAYGKVPPYKETQGYVSRILGKLGPSSAEASTPGMSRLQELEAHLARLEGQATPQPPQAPAPSSETAPTAPTPPRASQAPPTPSPDPSPTPGMRFQALPSITQLDLADRMQKTKLFESLDPKSQEEFLRSEEPASDLTVDIEKPSTPQGPPPQPTQPQGPDERPWWQRQLMPRVTTPGPTGPPPDLDEALTRELTPAQKGMTGVLLGGAAGAAGAALGRGAASLLGRGASLLPALGEAAGSYGGRQANIELGNEQPGTLGDVLAAGGPLVTRAVGALAPAIVKRLPGSAGAQHELMAERLQAVPAKMTPPTPSQTLYRAVVQQGNPAIPVQDLRQTAQELLAVNAQRGAATRNPRVVRLAQEIDDLAQQYNDNVPMDVLYDRMQGAREILKQARRTGGRGERDLSRIYAGFHGSLENAAQSGIPGAETLQQAINASRKEHAVDRLGRIVGQGRGIEEQAGSGYTFVKGKKMLNEFDRLLADDPVFAGSFTKPELAEMRTLFQEATKLPALPSAGGAQFGSGRAAVRASIGSMLGGPAGAAIAVSGPEVIARAMMTTPGRAMLRAALEGRGGLTPQALAVLNTALREQLPAEK